MTSVEKNLSTTRIAQDLSDEADELTGHRCTQENGISVSVSAMSLVGKSTAKL